MKPRTTGTGVSLALVCLLILGTMPVISNGRPPGFAALSFAFWLSLWQLLVSLPLVLRELTGANRGIFSAELDHELRRRTIVIILATGALFGLSTHIYVVAMEKAGAASAAIAIQAYPLFAILLESVLLRRRKSALELLFTTGLIGSLYYLATSGTWRIDGISQWFLAALCIPLLWSIAHVTIKEVLDRTPITPAQVTFFRVLVSSVFLGIVLLSTAGTTTVLADLARFDFQVFAAMMGIVYYAELIIWFHAVRHIDVSLASSITVPWPALTMILSALVLGDRIEAYQAGAFIVVAVSIYGLIFAGRVKARRTADRSGP